MPTSGRPAGTPDLLRVPVLGRFLRWRHARSVLQAVLLGLAALVILDGLFGPELAPMNLAGTLPWVHWRGFVVLALLVAGNLFCMACPFMLPRRLAKRFGPARFTWPPSLPGRFAPLVPSRLLDGKWLAVALLLLFFWAYEAFALWSSPWLTAWVAVTYFALAFVIDGFFRGAAFCKHVCPIGQFHFVNAMVSPTEVSVRDPEVCGRCRTLDCILGRYDPAVTPTPRPTGPPPIEVDASRGTLRLRGEGSARPPDAASGQAFGRRGLVQGGCELALFQPRKTGNGDCTFCMECIHACPHDNIGILVRSPLTELSLDPVRSGMGRLSRRPDWAALALLLTFAAFLNASGMVEPVLRLHDQLGARIRGTLGFDASVLGLTLFFVMGLVAIPGLLTAGAAWMSRALSGGSESLVRRASTYAWALVPLGFGMWTAHYILHFLVGGPTIIPVARRTLADLGLPAGGEPDWGAGTMLSEGWILPLELFFLQTGLLLTLVVGFRIGRREEGGTNGALRAFLPWAVLATLLALAGLWLLTQPMEMRGTFHVM